MAAEVANNQAVPAEENTATEKKVDEVEAASKEQGAILFAVFILSLIWFNSFFRLSIVVVVVGVGADIVAFVAVTEKVFWLYSMYWSRTFKWRYDF